MTYRYILFNKPFNVLSQFSDARTPAATSGLTPDRQLLKDFIPVPDVYPVGRLDHDSEGLMLLTNDGPLQHRLSHPKFQHRRTYWIQVEHIPGDRDLEPIRQGGLRIQNYQPRPAEIQLIPAPDLPPRHPPVRYRQAIPTAWLEISLTEGRNRQVRRMTAAIGFPTLRLVRVAIGPLRLTDLAPGQWRDLTPAERQSLGQ
jgi:23S rRNA pseudouridine2457 synthase